MPLSAFHGDPWKPPADCPPPIPPETGSVPGATAPLSGDIYRLGSGHRVVKSVPARG